jgi:transmembrane sensor
MQNNKENFDIKILLRYLEGEPSDEDKYIVKQWLSDSQFETELNEKSFQFWEGISQDPKIKGYNGNHILDRIHHNIKIEEGVFLNKTKPKIRFVSYLIRIAAFLFIPLLVASLFLYHRNNSYEEIVSCAEIHAPIGTRTNFYLPDGSTGWLNGSSSLKFPIRFNGKSRDVKLVGEAYFNVTSNHNVPFIVSTKNIDIKVFGTSFNVMAYADEQTTEITLESGQVEIFKKTNSIVKSIGKLKPNESCIYNFKSNSSSILSVNSSEKLSWLDGKLTFKYEPFGDVVRKINRWYNVNILIKDKLLESYIYYGTFKDETLDEVLKLLQLTAPIRYKDIGREINQDGTFAKRKVEIYYRR